MTKARQWLPLDVVVHAPVRDVIASAVDDWSQAWFAKRRLHAREFAAVAAGRQDDRDGWVGYGEALAVNCSPRACSRLRGWALDHDTETASSSSDRELLEAFERRLIHDLAMRLQVALGLEAAEGAKARGVGDPTGRDGGLTFVVADEQGDALMVVAAPLASILPTCKASLSPAAATTKLQSLRSALGNTRVSLEAVLGSAELSLPDLHALSPGDVLVLDTALQDFAILTLPGSSKVLARAKLAEQAGALTLTLEA